MERFEGIHDTSWSEIESQSDRTAGRAKSSYRRKYRTRLGYVIALWHRSPKKKRVFHSAESITVGDSFLFGETQSGFPCIKKKEKICDNDDSKKMWNSAHRKQNWWQNPRSSELQIFFSSTFWLATVEQECDERRKLSVCLSIERRTFTVRLSSSSSYKHIPQNALRYDISRRFFALISSVCMQYSAIN